ncbi:MAG: hypothetical protein JWO13_3436 [Acidobacteriales bacterium]|nr:hypothetical protein [Terriglobales bacterium]
MVLSSCTPVFAHTGGESEILHRDDLLRAWTWDPLIIFMLIVSLVLYALGVMRMRARSERNIKSWQIASFAAGWLALVFALVSPLHKLGSVLFSAHMGQHEVLMLIAAPLLVMSQPMVPFLWALPFAWRESIGEFFKRPAIRRSWIAITGPLAVWIIHGVAVWGWHLPVLYQATLQSELAHAIQHTSFLGTALLFWWTLIHGRFGRMSYGISVVYVFTTAIHTSILGALLTFGREVWYPIYAGRTAAWGLTPLEDQQLGGLIMWVPGGLVFIAVGLGLFAAWLSESDRRLRFTELATLSNSAERSKSEV